MEQELRGYSERMLTGVLTRYGKESPQYRQAGGKLRKAPSKRSADTPTVTLETVTIQPPVVVNAAMAAMN